MVGRLDSDSKNYRRSSVIGEPTANGLRGTVLVLARQIFQRDLVGFRHQKGAKEAQATDGRQTEERKSEPYSPGIARIVSTPVRALRSITEPESSNDGTCFACRSGYPVASRP